MSKAVNARSQHTGLADTNTAATISIAFTILSMYFMFNFSTKEALSLILTQVRRSNRSENRCFPTAPRICGE